MKRRIDHLLKESNCGGGSGRLMSEPGTDQIITLTAIGGSSDVLVYAGK